jgi:hypothetical protein
MPPPARLQHIKDRTMQEEEKIIPANVSYEYLVNKTVLKKTNILTAQTES